MLARNGGRRQRGVRRIEQEAPDSVAELAQTIARHDRADCWRALAAAVELYRQYRAPFQPAEPRTDAERAVLAYVAEQRGTA